MYKKRSGTFYKSILIGLITLIIINGLAYILDEFGVNLKLSTFIGLLTGLLFNFFMQFRLYLIRSNNSITSMIIYYIITDIMIMISYQYLVNKGIDDKKEIEAYIPSYLDDYYIYIIRLLVGALVWLFISYPLRKYWVFA